MRGLASHDLVQITQERSSPPLEEITHGLTLPEPDGLVVMWCRESATPGHLATPVNAWGPTHTFLWSPANPSTVTELDVPNPVDGSKDLFCGGHSWLADGSALAFGGTNLLNGPGSQLGHKGAFRLSKTGGQWSWSAVSDMTDARWYPYGFLIPGDELLVIGHSSIPTANRQDRFAPGTGLWTGFENRLLPGPGQNCSTVVNLANIGTYPRAHVLGRFNAHFHADVRGTPEDKFLDLDDPCVLPVTDRWQSYMSSGLGAHGSGTSVHFVSYDALSNAHDVIYYTGGRDNGPTSAVHVVSDPDPYVPVPWAMAPSLNHPREDLNAVIPAYGSILVVGGHDEDLLGTAIPHHASERLKPPVVFGSGSPTPWTLMYPQQDDRLYHSIAGLLPDGTVYSAGGDDEVPSATDSRHSIEIYKPPYLFWGPRPVVSGVIGVWKYTDISQQFVVTTRPSVGISHIGLIRFSSVTHGFDSDQRYVLLNHQDLHNPPGTHTVSVTVPSSESQAPKGDFMLFVVDTNGVPSVATIVRMS